ncbi:MAG: phosphate/phosphite/phosphonate ABC transporter substrate-binding protein [Thermoanaerobacteraceae bacterium]|nr:phosphate/phosphite/phosphonate ABC transporter substrate-binding protein [Thermoanaerobacteraceae bacterium]
MDFFRKFSYVMPVLILLLFMVIMSGCSRTSAPFIDLTSIEDVTPGEGLGERPVRVAISSITSPSYGRAYYEELLAYLSRHLHRPVQVIQRRSYAEVNDLLRAGEVDVAFICTYSYVAGHDEFGLELLVAPQIDGKVTYCSYLIARADGSIRSFDDLRGRRFAFTDPMSTTGTLYPQLLLKERGETAESFFRSHFYTYSHDNSIMAVVEGLADGAAVESEIFNFLAAEKPELTGQLEIIHRSPEYGMPPVVARPDLEAGTKAGVRDILMAMHLDEDGQTILRRLHIERFVPVEDSLYEGVRELARSVRNGAASDFAEDRLAH